MDLARAKKIIEKGKINLIELVNDEIKKNWVKLEKEFITARDLIANIGRFSKEGLDALEAGSCQESLTLYKQIISQLQIYNENRAKVG